MSVSYISNTNVPFCQPVPCGVLSSGVLAAVDGFTFPHSQRFAVNFQSGPCVNPRDDLPLHVSVRFDEARIVRNSLYNGGWLEEERFPDFMPLVAGGAFNMMILCDNSSFKIAFNGVHYCEFVYRQPLNMCAYLSVDGDVQVNNVQFSCQSQPTNQHTSQTLGAHSLATPQPMGGSLGFVAPPTQPVMHSAGYQASHTASAMPYPPMLSDLNQQPFARDYMPSAPSISQQPQQASSAYPYPPQSGHSQAHGTAYAAGFASNIGVSASNYVKKKAKKDKKHKKKKKKSSSSSSD